MATQRPIAFSGHASFRQRLVLATLAGRAVRIDKIRADDEDQPGLRGASFREIHTGVTELDADMGATMATTDFEVNFLRLLEKVTNGTTIEINYTGWWSSLPPYFMI